MHELNEAGQAGLSWERGGEGRNRTGDTTVFSRVLYQLSYLASAAESSAEPVLFSRKKGNRILPQAGSARRRRSGTKDEPRRRRGLMGEPWVPPC